MTRPDSPDSLPPMTIPYISSAYRNGQTAFAHGVPRSDNPCTHRDRVAMWSKGWDAAALKAPSPKIPMPIHTDYVTDITHAEDVPYLRKPLFDVNMRLFGSCPAYRALVLAACDHLRWCVLTKAEGYKLPHGFSGANAGIPWNIIAIAERRGTPKASALIMINPKIVRYQGDEVETQSNCGSIRLPEPITIKRRTHVDVSWYDLNGNREQVIFGPESGSYTIQHEVDHNLGVLITDRATPAN